jgi:uncharacterized damage-inducible protein DinB
MPSQQETTLAGLAAARQELLDALAGLTDADLESPLGPDQWRIRDMLAHINHWNRWGLNRIRHKIEHGEEVRQSGAIHADEVNRLIAEAWDLHPVQDVLMEFQNCYEDVVTFIRSLPPEWTEETWQYHDRPMTLQQWFGFPADHESQHAEQLQAWRAARKGC